MDPTPAGSPATTASHRARSRAGSASSASQTGGRGPRRVASRAARVVLSARTALASGMPAQPLDGVASAEDQSGLRSAEQLVAAAGHDGSAVGEGGGGVRLVGQQSVRSQQTTADVVHHRWAQRRELAHTDGRGEPLHREVARVHLEQAAGVGADCSLVVGERRAVGRADLTKPGTRARDEVRQPEAVADLDHLAAADDHLAPRRERGRGEHERRRSVVDHQGRLGLRNQLEEGRERAATTGRALPGREVELDVDGPSSGTHRPRRRRPTGGHVRGWCG